MKNKYLRVILVILVLALLVIPTISSPKLVSADTVVSVSVNASSDDTIVSWNGIANWNIDNAYPYLFPGYANSGNYKGGVGTVFKNVPVPQGVTITVAHIIYTCVISKSTTGVKSVITGENTDNASTFSTLANYQGRRGVVVGGANDNNLTTANVTWDDIPAWVAGTSYNSPSIISIAQEIVDRPGWVSGNTMGFFWDDHAGRSDEVNSTLRFAAGWDDVDYPQPVLYIEYESAIVIPTVTAGEATPVGDTWFVVPGEITATGGENCTSWGTQYGLQSGGVLTDNITNTGSKGLGTWSDNCTPVLPGTTYIYRTFAINSAGIAYSDEGTYVAVPTISTLPATLITSTTARISGNVTATSENCTVHIYMGLTDGGTDFSAWTANYTPTSPSQPQSIGLFYYDATDLPPGTTIYANVSANNTSGTGWATAISFLTIPAPPSNVMASDGTSTENITLSWDASTGATGYWVLRDGIDLVDVGNVTSYVDLTAGAPTITAGTAVASDGTSNTTITMSLSGQSVTNGTSYIYSVKAYNASGNSSLSITNTGYRGHGILSLQWWGGNASDNLSSIIGGTTNPYNWVGPFILDQLYYTQAVLTADGAVSSNSTQNIGYITQPTPSTPAPTSTTYTTYTIISMILSIIVGTGVLLMAVTNILKGRFEDAIIIIALGIMTIIAIMLFM